MFLLFLSHLLSLLYDYYVIGIINPFHLVLTFLAILPCVHVFSLMSLMIIVSAYFILHFSRS